MSRFTDLQDGTERRLIDRLTQPSFEFGRTRGAIFGQAQAPGCRLDQAVLRPILQIRKPAHTFLDPNLFAKWTMAAMTCFSTVERPMP